MRWRGRKKEEPPPVRSVPPPAARPPGPRFDAATWGALFALGLLLFAAGVYLSFAIAGSLPSAVGRGVALYPLPFAFTIAGGVLSMHAFVRWRELRHDPRRGRVDRVSDMRSFEIYRPPRG